MPGVDARREEQANAKGRPAGPPLTRWPRTGQLRARRRLCAAPDRKPSELSRPARLRVWPGVRRAGRSTAEPGADAGPSGAVGAALILITAQFGNGVSVVNFAELGCRDRFLHVYGEKIRSMISAPVAITGRSSRR